MAEPFRHAHSLRPNAGTPLPSRAIFIDTETKKVPLPDGRTELVFKMGWAAYWRRDAPDHKRGIEWLDIRSADTFWDWLESKIPAKTKLYVFAFNLFFDFSILNGQKALIDRGWKAGYPYYEGQTAIHRWRKGKRTIVCLDVGNYFPGSLERLGESIGLEKGEVDFDTVDDATLSRYCRQDVRIILKAMTNYFDFVKMHDLGGFRVTASSQAMAAFRHRFMGHKIWLHGDPDVVALERKAYHGGRVSMLFKGTLPKQPYYKLDYNSAYPSVYGHFEYPTNFISMRPNLTLAALEETLKTRCVIATVDLVTDEPAYPILRDHRLYFPVGSFTSTLTTRELAYALKHGHIIRVGQVAVYRKAQLFKRFVEDLYALRLRYKADGNKGFEYMVKRMLNGLSGKWGQHKIVRKILGTADPYIMHIERVLIYQTRKLASVVTYGGKVYLETKEHESYNAFVAIVAHITADLRMKLWGDVQTAGLENCYYFDTDSIFVNEVGKLNLRHRIDPLKLGYLKIEGTTRDFTIFAPKDYRFGENVKTKGVPKRAKQLDDGRYLYDQFQGWSGAMRKKEIGHIVTRPIKKTLHRKLTQGKLGLNGRVIPFDFPGDIYDILDPYPIQSDIEILQEAYDWIPKIPQRVILAVWDYQTGDFRKAKDKRGNITWIELSKWDGLSTELGFANVDEFTRAVRRQVERRSGQRL